MAKLLQHRLTVQICPFAFMHYSVPPVGDQHSNLFPASTSGYHAILADLFTQQQQIAGQNNFFRSNLGHHVHPSQSIKATSAAAEATTTPQPSSTTTKFQTPSIPVVIGMAISNYRTSPSAGDIFTARELANSLLAKYNVRVKYLIHDDNWYDAQSLDILLVFLDYYELPRVYNMKPGLMQVAWLRNWFQRWISRPFIGNYDLLLVSSTVAETVLLSLQLPSSLALPVQCLQRCPSAVQSLSLTRNVVPVKLFRIATNAELFSPLPSEESMIAVQRFAADYVFSGSYWQAERDIMALDPQHPQLRLFSGSVIGKQWLIALQRGEVKPSWETIIKGEVPYDYLPDIYRRSKIVIDDANHVTKPWGSVNSRVFDALAAGVLVLTNGRLGSEDVFNGLLPVYESPEELMRTLALFLNEENKRNEILHSLRHVVLEQHTYPKRAEELSVLINSMLSSDMIQTQVEAVKLRDQKPKICIGIRVYEGQSLVHLKLLLQSLELQRNAVPDKDRHLDLSYFVVNTDEASVQYLQALQELLAAINDPSSTSNKSNQGKEAGGNLHNEEYDTRSRAWLFDNGALSTSTTSYKALRGHDVVDRLLYVLQHREECAWVLMTNGDTLYHTVSADYLLSAR